MARRFVVLASLLTAQLTWAQTTSTSLTYTESNDSDLIINIAECNNAEPDQLFFNWTYSGYTGLQGNYRLTISDTTGCPSTAHNQVYDNIPATAANGGYPSSGNPRINVSTLLQTLNVTCPGSATAIYVCIDYTPSAGAAVSSAVTGTVKLDLAKPPAPSITSVTPGDGALNINWTAGSGGTDTSGSSSTYTVVVTNASDPADTRQNTVTSTSYRMGGLTNGVTYNVVVYAFSPGDNQSDPSTTATGTPQAVNDFWRLYRNETGAKELGGCATGTVGAAALVALVPLALRRRRRP